VHQPQNILLDELAAAGLFSGAMRAFIRRLRDEAAVCFPHIMQEVSMLCDNIVVLAPARWSLRDRMTAADDAADQPGGRARDDDWVGEDLNDDRAVGRFSPRGD